MAAIPDRYDVAINGKYYKFAEWEQRRALYSLSPTFLERQNFQGDWGDNQFDFWLTWTQRDWQLGEQQRYWRGDADRSRREWDTSAVNLKVAGQVTMRPSVATLALSETAIGGSTRGGVNDNMIVVGSASFHEVSTSTTVTAQDAHTITSPKRTGITSDGSYIYLSSYAADKVVRWSGSGGGTIVFAATTGADVLEFLNNTLYGITGASRTFAGNQADYAQLVRWDTGGTMDVLFQWKQAMGDARLGRLSGMKAYGGKLLILWGDGPNGSELWEYDGTAPAMIAQFPKNFYAYDLEIVTGVVYVSGSYVYQTSGSNILTPCVYYFANGTIGKLWEASTTLSSSAELDASPQPALTSLDGGVIWNDDTRSRFVYFNTALGGVHAIGTYSNNTVGQPVLCSGQRWMLHIRAQANMFFFPTATTATTSTITTSLIDMDSTLSKWFKSIRYHGDVPTGATVDLAYRLEDPDGSFTTIQTDAVPNTEYAIGVAGKSITIRVTLNKGSSTEGPTLKKLFLRAAPIQDAFKRRDYLLDVSGRNGKSHVVLRDNSLEPRDGMTMAAELFSAAVATSPVTIIDRFGTYTGFIDATSFQIVEIRPEEFLAIVRVREV